MTSVINSLALLVFAAASFTASQAEVKVNYVTPNFGGKYGATQVRIFGQEFDTNLVLDTSEPTKEVMFVSPFNQYECVIHDAESDENQIVCYTGQMDEDNYYVRVRMNGVWLDSSQYCGGNDKADSCRFTVQESRTPYISTLSWVTGEPEQLLHVRGRLFTNRASSAEATASNGATASLRRVWMTAGMCDLYDEDHLARGIELDGAGSSQQGGFTCQPKGTYVGNQNVSFIVDQGFGRSVPVTSVRHVSADNRIYMLQTYAVITDVSPDVGSVAGGTLITISGRNFDGSSGTPVRVVVGGEPCEVQNVTSEEITCLTPPETPTRTLYSGGRGFDVELYSGQTSLAASPDESTITSREFHDKSFVSFTDNNAFVSRTRGFFIPATDAKYSFTVTANDDASFFFNQNGNEANEAVGYGSGTTPLFSLSAGKEYFYELRHKNSGGSAWWRVSVYADRTVYTPQETASAVSEVQTITTTHNVVPEVQDFTFTDWTPGEGVMSLWNITFNCTTENCQGTPFFLTIMGQSTDFLYLEQSREEEVKSAIEALVVMAGEHVNVTIPETNVTEPRQLVVKFLSFRGRIWLNATTVSPLMSISVEEVVEGVPDLSFITLAVDGRMSDPIPKEASEAEFASGVKSLFGPRCPYKIERGIGGEPLRYFDAEANSYPSGQRTVDQSYCGLYSIVNPSYLVHVNEGYNPAEHTHVCFAYMGPMSDVIRVSFTYTEVDDEGEETLVSHELRSLTGVGLGDSLEEWTHFCYDLNARLLADHPSARDIAVTAVAVFGGDSIYVDNIFIGRTDVTMDELQDAKRLILPTVASHIKLEGLTVENIANGYRVSILPKNCGNNLPLLGLAFYEEVSRVSDNEVVFSFGNSTPQIRVERVTPASTGISGAFDIGFDDASFDRVEGVPVGVGASALENLIETVTQVDAVAVSRSGNCYGYSWKVTFLYPGGDFPLMKINSSAVDASPNKPTMSVHASAEGGLRLNPARGDFFRTAHQKSQVQVYINGVPSQCGAHFDDDAFTSCDFEWKADATPHLSSVDPPSGPVGTSISIAGQKLGLSGKVTVGGVECQVEEHTETRITCVVGKSPSGNQDVVVRVDGEGLAQPQLSFSVVGTLTAITPTSGSEYGCTNVTITGSGFERSTTVAIGGSPCHVTSSTYETVTCVTSSGSAGSASVVATTSGVETSSSDVRFTYQSSDIGTISEVSRKTFFCNGGEELVISGSGFGVDTGRIFFGKHLLTNVTSWADDSIVLTHPSLPPGSYGLVVEVPGVGCAGGSVSVNYTFSVSSVSVTSGSLVGGTPVVITGTGLTSDVSVKFGEYPCKILHVNDDGTALNCSTGPARAEHLITNAGRHVVYGIGYAWLPSTLAVRAGDQVTFQWNTPFLVDGINVGVFTTRDTSSRAYDDDGFEVSSAPSGRHSFTINTPGKLYFASGCVDGGCHIFMRGVLNVAEASGGAYPLNVSVNGIQALDSENWEFAYDSNLTPIVKEVQPRFGTTDTLIVIAGEGFNNQPLVEIGGKPCDVHEYNETVISCKVDPFGELGAGVRHNVRVNIPGKGDARVEIRSLVDRTFLLLPRVESVSPAVGSLAGGTVLMIEGSGFDASMPVRVGSAVCAVVGTTYTTITCITQASTAMSVVVDVFFLGSQSAECASSCEYAYDDGATPKIRSWDHTGEWGDKTFTFTGEGFGTELGVVTVNLTSDSRVGFCVVTSVSDTEVVCDVGRFAVGTNDITLHVGGKGLSLFNGAGSTIISEAIVDSVSPMEGSINGGQEVHIQGNGFVDGDTDVTVGGVECVISLIDLANIRCVTGARAAGAVKIQVTSNSVVYNEVDYDYSAAATPAVDSITPAEGVGGDVITIVGSGYGTDFSDVVVLVGNVSCVVTSIVDDRIDCTLGEREGGAAEVKVLVVSKGLATVSETFRYSLRVENISTNLGSYAGGQMLTFTGQGFSSNSNITICDKQCDVVGEGSPTSITCLTPANEDRAGDDCEIRLTNGDSSTVSTLTYRYDPDVTPMIANVVPNTGGTAGGTRVTITGNGFTGSSFTVSIGGVECTLIEHNDTQIIVETNAHQGSIKTKIAVTSKYGLATQDAADFHYVDRWSSIFTWGGTTLPTTEDFVIIGEGQSVLLDTDTAVLKMLLINGGELVFDEQDVTLNAENILIANGGRLQIGTEENPHQAQATIKMHGHLRSLELPIYGTKTLAVRSGSLELHGRFIPNPWTRLNATAEAGSTEITLEMEAANWRVGDEIVIATTGLRHSQRETEKRRITDISEDKLTLTLNEALDYTHLGVSEDLEGTVVDFKAEVGLLSRNIVFRGSNDNPAWHVHIPACPDGFNTDMFATQTCFQGRFGEEIGNDQFGASIMMHSKFADSRDIEARIEGVEVTYAGQAFRLGRYPIHWHLMGDVGGRAYVKRCSIHQSFNRAITIHGTHKLLVEANVVYDVMGGAIFIEDGIETENVIQYNLVLFAKQSTSLLNDDITPAAYWVTNPNNVIQHNHAAGGTHFGFWYRMHTHPDGPSFNRNVCPQKVELGTFRNNTVHSQGWFGLWIFENYFPAKGSSCSSSVPSAARFHSLTTWNSDKGAEWVNVGAVHFVDFVMVNNHEVGIDAMSVTTWYGDDTGTKITNATLIARPNTVTPRANTGTGISLPIGAGMWVNGARFINFDAGTAISVGGGGSDGGFYNFFDGLSFENSPRRTGFAGWQHAVIIDRDGSLTDMAPMTVVAPRSGLVNTTLCPIFQGVAVSAAVTCPPDTHFHRITVSSTPGQFLKKSLFFSNQHGNATASFKIIGTGYANGWTGLLPTKEEYRISVVGKTFTNFSYTAQLFDMQAGDHVFINHSINQMPDVITVNGRHRYSVANSTAIDEQSANLAWHYDRYSQTMRYIIARRACKKRSLQTLSYSSTTQTFSPVMYRCLYPDCKPPANPYDVPPTRDQPTVTWMWSDENNPCLERPDENTVVVKRSVEDVNGTQEWCWVIVDRSPIVVDNITIEGTLQFSNMDVNVSAIYIMVQGGRIIAGLSEEEFFPKKLTFELRGNSSETTKWELPGVSLGAKGIGCFGGCDFHGKPHNVYWTHLEMTADVGASTIVLMKEVDWTVGDEIVITTTGYRSNETEKHVIAAVAGDNRTISLSRPLEYRHMGKSYTVGVHSFDMKAEVGLLTRNIVIRGVNYSDEETDMAKDAFGARVIVGNNQAPDGGNVEGWARVHNVEFVNSGQEGEYSIRWWDTGRVSVSKPSYVIGCSFHDGFATAIGVELADGMVITNNVIHRTINDGIRLSGSDHILEGNLVTMALAPSLYMDKTGTDTDWHASFDVTLATRLTMRGNTAAGSHKVCFHVNGEDCQASEDDAWTGNVAHGCVHGIQLFRGPSVGSCTMLRNFVVYKASDYGIYHQTKVSAVIRNVKLIDTTVAYIPLLVGPVATTHAYSDMYSRMEGCLCVGRSDDYDPAIDVKSGKEFSNQGMGKAAVSTKTCVILPKFESAFNKAPKGLFHDNRAYPALHGVLNITDLHVHNYKQHSDGRDVVFVTNPHAEDAIHPTHLHRTTVTEVDAESKAFFMRPLTGKINPADCVDMECDAKKKALIKDVDGGFLGEPGAIIPEAEYGWDKIPGLGLGDYRVPKAMRTGTDGTVFSVDEIADGRGIEKTSSCVYMEAWQAYDCHGNGTLDYHMMVIESLDGDSESRRLSPVALLGDRYIDLNNGPQDHGWCSHYTCQKRLSTFWVIVAAGKHFDIFFTGYAPRRLRLHFLNVDDTKTVRVAIWYPRPERLDIIQPRTGVYIHPENSYYDVEGDFWGVQKATPENNDLFKPAIDASVHGANYMDRTTRLLYVTLRGNHPIDITTSPAIILGFNVPPIAVDDFFEENLVRNLALFLNVPSYKIRVVNVVRETSRKRRDTSGEVVTYQVMFSDEMLNTSATNLTSEYTAEYLNSLSENLLLAYQTETLWERINITGLSYGSTQAVINVSTETDFGYIVEHKIPRSFVVTQLATTAEEYIPLAIQPSVIMNDELDEQVTTLGGHWRASISLVSSDPAAELVGQTTATFEQGMANFTDLRISMAGEHSLRFEIVEPSGIVLVSPNPTITITERQIDIGFHGIVTTMGAEGVNFTVELLNSIGTTLEAIDLRGHTWKVEVSFDDPAIYGRATLGPVDTFTFDATTSMAVTSGLLVRNMSSYHNYNFVFRVFSEPEQYNFTLEANAVQYIASNASAHLLDSPETSAVSIDFAGQPYTARASTAKKTFDVFVHNSLVDSLDGRAYMAGFQTSAVEGNTRVTFSLIASSAEEMTIAADAMYLFLSDEDNGFAFGGSRMEVLSASCAMQLDGACYSVSEGGAAAPVADPEARYWVFVVVAAIAVLVACVTMLVIVLKRMGRRSKVGSSGGCLDANSSRGSTPGMTAMQPNVTPSFT